MKLLDKIVEFILKMTKKYNIDDSHSITHSFDIFHYTNEIYTDELSKNPQLKKYEKIIFVSSLIHDMCDKKYMELEQGIKEVEDFLVNTETLSFDEIIMIRKIIETMSYSTVKKNGFPELGEYQMAYHIVREADLLCAYDVDRCIIFHLYNNTPNNNMKQAVQNADHLFTNRIFKHREHGLILLNYSNNIIPILERESIVKLGRWKNTIKTF
jgi:hypothetical protein